MDYSQQQQQQHNQSQQQQQQMMPLPSQEFFEGLIQKGKSHEPMVVVRFTASWCGPCKRVNTDQLLALSDQIKWYVADIDEEDNLYTLGYCGLKQIPGFMAIKDGVPQTALQSSNTYQISGWLQKVFEL